MQILILIFLTLIFCISTSLSVYITGQRHVLEAFNSFKYINFNILKTVFIAFFFGIIARVTFLYINKLLYNIPKFSDSSTLLTVSITSLSYIFIIAVNSFFLKEEYNNQIYLGFFLIVIGILVVFNAK